MFVSFLSVILSILEIQISFFTEKIISPLVFSSEIFRNDSDHISFSYAAIKFIKVEKLQFLLTRVQSSKTVPSVPYPPLPQHTLPWVCSLSQQNSFPRTLLLEPGRKVTVHVLQTALCFLTPTVDTASQLHDVTSPSSRLLHCGSRGRTVTSDSYALPGWSLGQCALYSYTWPCVVVLQYSCAHLSLTVKIISCCSVILDEGNRAGFKLLSIQYVSNSGSCYLCL